MITNNKTINSFNFKFKYEILILCKLESYKNYENNVFAKHYRDRLSGKGLNA